jgi:hypothetical protein
MDVWTLASRVLMYGHLLTQTTVLASLSPNININNEVQPTTTVGMQSSYLLSHDHGPEMGSSWSDQ